MLFNEVICVDIDKDKVEKMRNGEVPIYEPHLDVLFENELRLETDRDMMQYNAEVAKQQKENDAINLRAEADIERYRGKVARKVSYFKAGQSLLNTGAQFQGG